MAGRPRREEEVAVMTLRIPHPLLERVNRCKALVELQEGANLSRTEVLWRIIEDGCQVLEGQLARPGEILEVVSEISVPPNTPETPGRPLEGQQVAQVGAPARMRPRGTQRPLPPHITRIVEERAKFQYSRLTLDDFARHLFDTGIYKTRANDGTEQPVNRGTLQKWLKRAEQGGML
jgi:hypothetical protein